MHTAPLPTASHQVKPQLAAAVLGLSVLDTLEESNHPQAKTIADDLIRHALKGNNGYCAREVLNHSAINAAPHDDLAEVVASCGLGLGRIPETLQHHLNTALDTCEAVLAHASPRTKASPPH